MIDNYEKANALIENMNLALPISARPTPKLLQDLKSRASQIPEDEEWQIESLVYLGDEGGIVCGICLPKNSTEALLVSLTHLRVNSGHPLSQRIREYQSRRMRRVAQQNPGFSQKQAKAKSKSSTKEKKRKRRR